MPTPPQMDGRSVVPLLVDPGAAARQGQRVPGSVHRHLAALAAAPSPPPRVASFHTYYNQGPWQTQLGASEAGRLDDWSNTCGGPAPGKAQHADDALGGERKKDRKGAVFGGCVVWRVRESLRRHTRTWRHVRWIGLHYKDGGRDLKLGAFDPWGKQTGFKKPCAYPPSLLVLQGNTLLPF